MALEPTRLLIRFWKFLSSRCSDLWH